MAITPSVPLVEVVRSFLIADATRNGDEFSHFLAAIRQLATERENHPDLEGDLRLAVSLNRDYSALYRLAKLRARLEVPRQHSDLRIAVFGGATTSYLVEMLELFLWSAGVNADIFEGSFGSFRQQLLSPSTELMEFAPQLVILATDSRDILRRPDIGCSREDARRIADLEIRDWESMWNAVVNHWNATVIQNNFDIPTLSPLGHHSWRTPGSMSHYIGLLNLILAENQSSNLVIHDLNGLVQEIGHRNWFDARMYHDFKSPCAMNVLPVYAHSLAALCLAAAGRSRKVLVLDLDNTLWGGIVGDVGADHVEIGQGTGLGEAFADFQRQVLELQKRGILLAVCSKNDENNARAPFLRRPEMILKLEHFACFVANWENKAANLRTISNQLNLGLDSFVFFDDNPVERALVRRFLPEVAVPDVPEDPADYVRALFRCRYFETISLTEEDLSRTKSYHANASRSDLERASADVPSFLRSLDMTLDVEPIHSGNLERVAQLVNKSNQFNLTTRRMTVAELDAIQRSPDWITRVYRLTDAFGDNGLISVAMLRLEGNAAHIENWIMSCRVLQRGVEQAVCNDLVVAAAIGGAKELNAEFRPTAKNGMVREHYPKMGFETLAGENGISRYRLAIDPRPNPLPHYIVRIPNSELIGETP